MSRPVDCPYFYGDYNRGREHEECRLIKNNTQSRPWRRKLCDSCPVPHIMRQTNSNDLVIEAEVGKRMFIFDQVVVTYAVCLKHRRELDNPRHCAECAQESEG